MNEARVYADGFERSFAEVKDLLEFLAERGRNAKWIRKPTNTLRLAPLEKEAQNLDAADASMEEILEDTEKNTQLVLKMRGESYPVRDCAIRTILSRAGVNGDGLRKLDKATYAKVVNYCLRVAKGDALIKIADGKVSAVHGGDKHDYCILDMKAMFETTCEYLNLNFKGSVYMEGSGIYDHSIVSADNHTLEQRNDSLQFDIQALRQKYNDLQQNNVQLEKQQNELKSHIEQMVQSEQLLQRDVRKYDEAPEWQLPEPGAFASAKSFLDKVVIPFVNKLKSLIKNLTIQCVRLKEEVLQLRKEKKRLSEDVEFYKGKIKDMSDRTELLQEKANDLERVKRYAGVEQIDAIIRKVKEQERIEQQIRRYDKWADAR